MSEYENEGAIITDDLSGADVIVGKEGGGERGREGRISHASLCRCETTSY